MSTQLPAAFSVAGMKRAIRDADSTFRDTHAHQPVDVVLKDMPKILRIAVSPGQRERYAHAVASGCWYDLDMVP